MSQIDFLEAPRVNKMPPPRAFQESAHRELRAGFVGGHQRQMLMSPTGSGKTYLAMRLIAESLARSRRAVFIADRKTLINQTSATANAYGLPVHGIIQASNPLWAPHRPFQIASAQTIEARGIDDRFDLVVVDEAHTLYDAVTEFITTTKAAVIGLSATPFTKGLGSIYSRVINAATMDELVRSGVLVPLRIYSCVTPDMVGAKKSGGEWTGKAAEERGMGIIGDIVREWLDRAEGRKTICFGSTITHCEEIARQFNEAGVRAMLFTGHTKDSEREDILAEYRKPDSSIRVLVSVEALAKGFDVPDVGCVCDARPLRKSLSTFVQIVGRGLRSSPGKEDCILLDFSGNIIRFADDFSDIYFNGLSDLDSGEKLDREAREEDVKKPSKACPSCGFKPMGRRCIKCGFEPVRASLVEHQHGKSVEVDVLGNAGPDFVRKGYAKTAAELYAMIATHEKNRNAARVASGRKVGDAKGSAAHRYRELTGNWPNFSFEHAPTVQPSPALQSKLTSLQIAWARSRR